jgi:hypothetical protein
MFMKKSVLSLCVVSVLAAHYTSQAQFSMSALTSFGGGDGWLAPGEGGYSFLGIANNERGLAYGNGHLYLPSRTGGNFIRILNPLTSADLGFLNTTGVSGGTFAINKIGVGGDGSVYVGNLTTQSTTSPYKIYKWATEASAPTVAYTGNGGLGGTRIGDSTLAAIGSGSSTRLASGYANSPAVAGNNGYAIIDPTAGTATQVAFAGTPPAAGDFRLGLTFTDPTHVMGNQGSLALDETSFSGGTGTFLGTGVGLVSTAERPMSFATINGMALLATQSTGDSTVRIYDMSNPLTPLLLASGNNTLGALTANGNGTGDVVWGESFSNGDGTSTARLYAMSSNQGIQAFTVIVPEPGTASLAMLGAAACLLRRKLRR